MGNHSLTNLIMVSIKSVPRKIAQVLKAKINKLKKYQELPKADSHQEEVDENAQNEALEARLMELIASAPQQNLEQPWFLKLDQVPANLDHLPTLLPEATSSTVEAPQTINNHSKLC